MPALLGFLHYKALTTGWKTHEDRLDAVAIDAASLVDDRQVIDGPAAAASADLPPTQAPSPPMSPGRSRPATPQRRTAPGATRADA